MARSTNADGTHGNSYRAQADYNGNLFGASADFVRVDPRFEPTALPFARGTATNSDDSRRRSSMRFEWTPRLSFEPRVNINWLDIPFEPGRFRTTLAGSRVNFTFSPRSVLSALLQYNSTASTFGTNVRFRWEFTPGSDFFVVYSDTQDTEPQRALQGRSVVVKLARLFRF